jgi:methyl-accepting chemotaxis protein
MLAVLSEQMLRRVVQILVLDAALVVALVLGLRAVVLRPLEVVRDALAAIIGKGEVDLTQRLPAQSSVEFAALTEDLNQFVARLERMVTDVRLRAEEVVGGTGELAQGNNDLSQRTEQQSARVQQASSAVDQISSSVAANATSATEANGLARQANTVVLRGGQLMDGVVATMQSIADSSRRVTEIVGVIDSIAFQTNILALNAAVEAARAGDLGRGFAVVASEVRALAKRCADAAREIKTLIAQSAVGVEEGASRVNEAGITMRQIMQAIQAVSEQVEQISRATVAQSNGIGEISRSISSIDSDAQQNAALVEQSAATAATLSQAANGLVHLVAAFRVNTRPLNEPTHPGALNLADARH